MFNRLRASVQFVLASRNFRKKDLDKARLHLNKALELEPSDAVSIALDANISILEGNFTLAKARFEEARSRNRLRRYEDSIYLDNFCKYYECIFSDERPCDRYLKVALECGASKHIREWLILSDFVMRDGLVISKIVMKNRRVPAYEKALAKLGLELVGREPVGHGETQLVYQRKADEITPPSSKGPSGFSQLPASIAVTMNFGREQTEAKE